MLFLSLLLWPLKAQSPVDTISEGSQRVTVEHANSLEYQRFGAKEFDRLIGEVILSQDSIYMYCDSAIIENKTKVVATGEEVLIQQGDSLAAFADTLYYDATLKEAELIGNVILINGERQLFTDKLHYDLNTKIATYNTPAIITDGEPQGEPDEAIEQASRRLQGDETSKRVAFFSVGVENANMSRLSELAVRTPLKLNGLNFVEMFVWLSASMSAVSHSKVDEQVALPPIGWGSV